MRFFPMLHPVCAVVLLLTLLVGSLLLPSPAHARRKSVDARRTKTQLAEPPLPDSLSAPVAAHVDLPVQSAPCDPLGVRLRFKEGIDVSHYQGTIDWTAVAADEEIGYAYVKASEGATIQDDTHARNLRQARAAGLMVGSYHFFRANTSLDEQLANMQQMVKREQQDLVPIIDVEHTNGVSPAVLRQRLLRFMEMVTAAYGRKPMLYTFVNFYNKYLAGDTFADYPLMIAFYRDDEPMLKDGRRYVVWQYTASGDVDGVRGNVDRSRIMEGFTARDIMF